MVEKILIHKLDKIVRVQRACGDSGLNEAERTNSAIGNALVTGETLNWEYHQGCSQLDNWGGGMIFIYSGSAQLISFEINCFYGL